MKVSIITVAYNAAASIADTLRSVASQTYDDVEHIVVDGASKDGTQEVVARYGERVARFISEPDRGIYDAMNKGVALASGEVVCFLNADDVYAHDGVIAEVVDAMQIQELDALFGDAVFYRPEAPERLVRHYRSGRFRPSRIAWGWMPAHPAMFLRRQIFDRVGLFRTDYRIAGDFEFVARAFHRGELTYQHLPQVLVKMRTGGVSTSGWRNTLLLNREVLRACRENDISTNWLKILTKYPRKLMEFLVR